MPAFAKASAWARVPPSLELRRGEPARQGPEDWRGKPLKRVEIAQGQVCTPLKRGVNGIRRPGRRPGSGPRRGVRKAQGQASGAMRRNQALAPLPGCTSIQNRSFRWSSPSALNDPPANLCQPLRVGTGRGAGVRRRARRGKVRSAEGGRRRLGLPANVPPLRGSEGFVGRSGLQTCRP